MFSGVRSLIVLKGWEETEHLREKGGLLRRAPDGLPPAALGLGTCWVGGTFDKESEVFALAKERAELSVSSPSAMWPQRHL